MKIRKAGIITLCVLMGTFCFTAVSQADLVGFWEFEEGSGDVTADSTGTNADAVLGNVDGGLGDNGSAWVNDPERGSVMSFNGLADGNYVLAGDGLIPAMALDVDFTWAFWAKQTSDKTENNILLGNRMSISATDFDPRMFIKFTSTKFEWHMNGNGDDNMDYEDIPDDIWLFHAVVKKGANLTYYCNGVVGGAKLITQGLTEPQPLFFGGDNEGADGENWPGYLDNVRIYNEALSASDIVALYLADGGVPTSNAGDWELFK